MHVLAGMVAWCSPFLTPKLSDIGQQDVTLVQLSFSDYWNMSGPQMGGSQNSGSRKIAGFHVCVLSFSNQKSADSP